MENGLQPIELRDIDAGIQAKSSDLAIEGEFQRFPLTTITKNWSFGKRKGLTTRYGIMPFPGHASSDLTGQATHPLRIYGGYYNHNQCSSESTQAISNADVKNSWRNSLDIYENRKSALGMFIFKQRVQPYQNTTSDYPVLYWATMRQRTKDSLTAYQFDLCPSCQGYSINGTTSAPLEVVSQYEAGIGAGTATIPRVKASFLSDSTESDASALARSTARMGVSDLVSLRRSNQVQWYMRFANHKYNSLYIQNNFMVFSPTSRCNNTKPGSSAIAGFYPNFGTAGFFAPLWNVRQPKNPEMSCFCFVYDLGGTPVYKYASWSATIGIGETVERPNDITNSRNIFRGHGPFYDDNLYSGKLILTDATWTKLHTPTFTSAPTYDYLFCSTNLPPVNIPQTIAAMCVGKKPIIALSNEQNKDKMETVDGTTGTIVDALYNASYDGERQSYSNDIITWISPTEHLYSFLEYDTKQTGVDPTLKYTEDFGTVGTPAPQEKRTCWSRAPKFAAYAKTDNVVADRGVLESKKIYEYAFSIYNSLTGHETNVGTPAKVYTDTATNAAISIYPSNLSKEFSGSFNWATLTTDRNIQLPSVSDLCRVFSRDPTYVLADPADCSIPFNHLSYKFYYREVGSFEWLYSGERSFAQLYFKPYDDDLLIGSSDSVGLPGGQPGAYIDNSPLPADDYLDVVSFQGKLWWITKDTVRFSSGNSPFVYPVRNFIQASSGEFRGAIVHYFAGQAEAQGRLCVFGSKSYLDIRQTTNFQQMQIQVSASSGPLTVPVPDSNISVSERSTHTAFSGRTAVVAEGILYYWGPTGIFRDDGVNLPIRISDSIEPDLFTSYDTTKVDEFFAHYNPKSQEISFFYRPKTGTALTKTWTYSVRTEDWQRGMYGAWSQYEYTCLIDWAQDIDLTGFYGGRIPVSANDYANNVNKTEVPRGAGIRTVIGARADANATVSRVYFHDDQCDCGDMTPGTEMMVKAVSRIDASTVRLTFASDHNTSILSGAAVGGSVYIFGSQEYGKLTVSLDGLREIKAKGSGYLDIVDSSAYAGPDTLSTRSFFPVFFSNHAVPCVIDTNFFAPYGTAAWSRFRYSHLLIQPAPTYSGTVNPSATISWNCNHTFSTSASKTITVSPLNTRERTTQVIFDMQSPNMQSEGQGVQLGVSYNQIGPRWTLFAWTLWTAPAQGKRNLLAYQQ